MRRASMVWVLVLGLAGATPMVAAAQGRGGPAPTVEASTAALDIVPPDSLVKVRRPDVGPRLPEFVASIPLPVAVEPPAPKGNIVIPVTTALIVLAALVLILIIK